MKLLNHRLPSARCAGVALLLAALTGPAWADYQTTVTTQGPVGYWRLNETAAPHAPITSAANLGTLGATDNGTYNGDQSFLRGYPGALNSSDTAAQFNIAASDQAVQTPFDPALNPTNNFTVEAWLAPATATPDGGLTCALSCGHFGSPRSGWLLYQSTTGWAFRMYNQNGLNTALNLAINTNMVPGTFYHVVVTFDGTTATAYVNGVLLASGKPTSYVPGTDGPFSIATRSDNAFYWQGKADEVAFYGSVLTGDQVAAHYSAATTNASGYANLVLSSSPLVYFRLDEAGDSPAANLGSLGAAGNGAFISGSHPGATGPVPPPYPGFESGNKAVSFDGGGGYVSLPPLNINTNTVTITGWINATGGQTAATGLILSRSGTTVAGLAIDVAGGLALTYNWNDDPDTFNWASGISLPDSTWAFVALVVQPTQAAIYVGPGNNAASFSGVTNYLVHPNQAFDGTTLIGTDLAPDGAATAANLNGAVDEVAIFNRTLSEGEVYSQYASAIGNLPPLVFTDPQPPANGIYEGDTLSLVVDAGGTPDLGYQWRKGGQAIQGATTSTYVKANVTQQDNGNYDVVVTNAFGTATSQPALVSVTPVTPPSISQAPVGRTLYPGGNLNLTVVASGGQLVYQWQKDGSALPGATSSIYSVSSVTTNDAGSYAVTVTNKLGTANAGPVTVTVATPASGSYEATILADNPEAWWRLNESTAGTMFDSLGRHDGYYTNFPGTTPVTLGATGALANDPDTAASTDGTNPYFGLVPYDSVLGSAEFTLECWAQIPDSAANYCPVSFFQSSRQGEFLYADNSSGTWRGAIGGAGSQYQFYYLGDTYGAEIVPNKWMHLVITYGSSVNGLRTYVNGQGVDPQGYTNAYGNFPRNVSAPLLIAGVGGPMNYKFKGTVDEVAFYTHAMTPAQAMAHYSAGRYGTGSKPVFQIQPQSQALVVGQQLAFTTLVEGTLPLTYQWLKNGTALSGQTKANLTIGPAAYSDAGSYQLVATNPAGTTASATAVITVAPVPTYVNATNGLVLHLRFDGNYQDSSGRNNNGTAEGSPTFVTGVVGSGALHYSTKTDTGASGGNVTNANYVSLGTPADLQFGANTDFSVAFWIRLPLNYAAGDLPFLDSATNSDNNFGLTFSPTYGPGGGTAGGWQWCLNDGTNNIDVNSDSGTINDGNWHSLVTTFARTGNAITYLDGVVVDTRSIAGLLSFDTGGPIVIGQDPTGLYPEPGSADIDDVGVWRRALTPAEAVAIYYAGLNGTSFDTYGPVKIYLSQAGGKLVISWQGGTLLQAPTVNGPWTSTGATPPNYTVTPGQGNLFFKIQL